MDLLPQTPCVINRRFRLVERVAVYGQMALYQAEDAAGHGGQPVMLWLVPTRGPQAVALSRTLENLIQIDTAHILAPRATGEVVSGPGTGLTYLATERPDESLTERVAREPMDGPALCQLAEDVAVALSALHEQRLTHRALHPGLVFRCGAHWKLGGVGLAGRGPLALLSLGTRSPNVGFLAPEVLTGGSGRAADAWGLGGLLLYARCGVAPFDGDLDYVVDAILRDVSPRQTSLPQPLDLVLAGSLMRDPERRWSPGQVVNALRGEPSSGVVPPYRPPSRPRSVKAWPTRGSVRLGGLHRAGVTSVAWQGDALLSGSEDGSVVLSDTEGTVQGRWELGSRIGATDFSRGQRFVAAASNGQLLLGSRQTMEARILVLECPVRALAWRGTLQGITTAGTWVDIEETDGALVVRQVAPLLWCLSSDAEVAGSLDGMLLPGGQVCSEGTVASVLAVAHIERGTLLGRADGSLASIGPSGTTVQDGERPVLALAVQPRRLRVACLRADRTVQLVTVPELTATHALGAPGLCLAFSSDGQSLAVGLSDGSVGIWPVPP